MRRSVFRGKSYRSFRASRYPQRRSYHRRRSIGFLRRVSISYVGSRSVERWRTGTMDPRDGKESYGRPGKDFAILESGS